MKSKLSALKFIRNNKKQAWVMIAALSLTFMTMYVINFLFLTTQESFKSLFIEQPKRVAYVDLCSDTMGADGNSIIEKLKLHEGIDDVIYTQCLYANYKGIIGMMGYDFPLLEAEQIPAFLEHMDAELISGKMPDGPGEILVDERVIKNQGMEVNGYFNASSYGQEFTVVGVIKSDYLTCVGTPQGYTNSGWYMVILCDEENSNMTNVLNDIGIKPTEYDTIFDTVYWAKMYKELVTDMLDTALLSILIIVMIFLTIAILVAYISFMRSRVNEYCLYTSIGFSRKDIYGMMMREIGIIFGLSIVIGTAVTIVIMLLMGHLVLDNMGLIYKYFYPEHLLRILAAFFAIVGFLQIPVTVIINKIKTVDLIEE